MLMAGHQWGLSFDDPSMTGQYLILKSYQDSQKSCHQTVPLLGSATGETTVGGQKGVNAIKNQKRNKLCTLLQDQGVLCSCVSPEPHVCPVLHR